MMIAASITCIAAHYSSVKVWGYCQSCHLLRSSLYPLVFQAQPQLPMARRLPDAPHLLCGLASCLGHGGQQAGASSLQRLNMMHQPRGLWLPALLPSMRRPMHSQHGQQGTAGLATGQQAAQMHGASAPSKADAVQSHMHHQPGSLHAQHVNTACSSSHSTAGASTAVSQYHQPHHLPHVPPATALPSNLPPGTAQQNRAVWSAVSPALQEVPAYVPAQQSALAPSALRTAMQEWRLLDKAAYSHGWAEHVTWSRAAIAAAMVVVFAELMLLPTCAPGGTSLGSLLAEGVWSTLGVRTDLGSLLMGSTHLELVQGFSLTRKLAQAAVLGTVLHAVTRGRLHGLLNMHLAQPMHPHRGWYRWACFGIAGLAVVSCAFQAHDMLLHGMDSIIQLPSSAGLAEAPTGVVAEQATAPTGLGSGDPRTLPFRCRWFAESCVLTPMLEEAVFRGFLLTSLTRYLPVWGALAGSSAAFAACHFGSQAGFLEQLQLAASGCVLGLVFLRSRNLLAPITAHGVNNAVAWVQQNL